MNTREREFLERLRAIFLVEARDHLAAIAGGLLALESAGAQHGQPPQLETVFRHTHSLKGAARAAGFLDVEAVCQVIEDVFAQCQRLGRVLAAGDYDLLHRASDHLRARIDSGAPPAAAMPDDTAQLLRDLKTLLTGRSRTVAPAEPPQAAPGPPPVAPSAEADGAAEPDPVEPQARPRAVDETVRASARGLDRMLLAAEELLTLRQACAERAQDIQRLEDLLEGWGKRWQAAQSPMRRLRAGPGSDDGDARRQLLEFLEWSHGHMRTLEARVHALARAAARDGHLAARQIDELLDESKVLLMTSFDTATVGLPRLVRDLARQQHKDVAIVIGSDDLQLDRRIAEALKDPLVHLVRNAIDHGVEAPAERRAAGKPERATLRIDARLGQGNNVVVELRDDGRGLDAAALRAAAVRAGVVADGAVADLDDGSALDLAFRSGISTSPTVNEISGRGLGLAIVLEQVERLGGRITLQSTPGQGACFSILLPQSIATLRGLFVEAGGQRFVIPTAHVRRVARFAREAVRSVGRRPTLPVDGRTLPVSPLAQLLGLPAEAAATGPMTCVLLGAEQDELALAVDDVLGDDDVLVRRLRPPLLRIRHVAGATVLPSGKVVPILGVADLLKSSRLGAPPPPGAATPAPAARVARAVRVLLAEDSITSRLLLQGILESAGCQVVTAADGMEALAALRGDAFDLVVSDIEMPRLNGFDLTARIRADDRLAALPVILVTALARREDRERGMDAGANAYITKGGFDQRALLDAVRRLVPGAGA